MEVVAKPIPKDLIPGPKIKCGGCGVVIQSKARYHWDRCECGDLSIYGGNTFPELYGNKERAFDPESGDAFFQKCADTWCTNWVRTSDRGLCPRHLDELLERQTKRQKA